VKKHSVTLILVAMLCALCLAQDSPQKKVFPHRSQMKAVSADTLKWGPPGADWMQGTPPPEFSEPMRSEFAIIQGDPSKTGPFVIRIKSPDGEKVPPHWHPQDENLTVLQGSLFLGTGERRPGVEAGKLCACAQEDVAFRLGERRNHRPGAWCRAFQDQLRKAGGSGQKAGRFAVRNGHRDTEPQRKGLCCSVAEMGGRDEQAG